MNTRAYKYAHVSSVANVSHSLPYLPTHSQLKHSHTTVIAIPGWLRSLRAHEHRHTPTHHTHQAKGLVDDAKKRPLVKGIVGFFSR